MSAFRNYDAWKLMAPDDVKVPDQDDDGPDPDDLRDEMYDREQENPAPPP